MAIYTLLLILIIYTYFKWLQMYPLVRCKLLSEIIIPSARAYK